MKLTDNWSITSGPGKKDFQLNYEKLTWNEEKQKWNRASNTFYYPSFEQAANAFVKYAMINEAVDFDDTQSVVEKLEELKQCVLDKKSVKE